MPLVTSFYHGIQSNGIRLKKFNLGSQSQLRPARPSLAATLRVVKNSLNVTPITEGPKFAFLSCQL
jgi:hypothetical protein